MLKVGWFAGIGWLEIRHMSLNIGYVIIEGATE